MCFYTEDGPRAIRTQCIPYSASGQCGRASHDLCARPFLSTDTHSRVSRCIKPWHPSALHSTWLRSSYFRAELRRTLDSSLDKAAA